MGRVGFSWGVLVWFGLNWFNVLLLGCGDFGLVLVYLELVAHVTTCTGISSLGRVPPYKLTSYILV